MDQQLQEELKKERENPTTRLVFNQEWTGRRMGKRLDECQRCGSTLQGVFYEWWDRITKKQVVKARCCEICYNNIPKRSPREKFPVEATEEKNMIGPKLPALAEEVHNTLYKGDKDEIFTTKH